MRRRLTHVPEASSLLSEPLLHLRHTCLSLPQLVQTQVNVQLTNNHQGQYIKQGVRASSYDQQRVGYGKTFSNTPVLQLQCLGSQGVPSPHTTNFVSFPHILGRILLKHCLVFA